MSMANKSNYYNSDCKIVFEINGITTGSTEISQFTQNFKIVD